MLQPTRNQRIRTGRQVSAPNRSRRFSGHWSLLLMIGLVALLSSPAAAESDRAPVAEPIAGVAGSLPDASRPDVAASGPDRDTVSPAEPLTRATVRARIAEIDPEVWLSRFGKTEHRETGRR